jgi:hypothetical protein
MRNCMKEYANRKNSKGANPNNELEGGIFNVHSALIKICGAYLALTEHSDRIKHFVFRMWCQRGRK